MLPAENAWDEVYNQIADFFLRLRLETPALNGFGLGVALPNGEEIRFVLFLEEDIPETEKQEIIKKFTKRFLEFDVVGKITLQAKNQP